MNAKEWTIEAMSCDCMTCHVKAEHAIERAMAEARAQALREALSAVEQEFLCWDTSNVSASGGSACKSIESKIRKLAGGAT